MQSEALTRFYQAYLAWVEEGAPVENYHNFMRGYGLCVNINRYMDSYGITQDLQEEMMQQFKAAGLSVSYPFSQCHTYNLEKGLGTCYRNNNRMAWVRVHAQGRSWACWSCKQPVTMKQRADADGNCPHCNAELDIELWPFPESAA